MDFEKVGISFNYHTSWEHGIWTYVDFLITMKFKSPTDYNSNDFYISKKIENQDLS